MMKLYSAIKNNKIMILGRKWMRLENTILSEVIQDWSDIKDILSNMQILVSDFFYKFIHVGVSVYRDQEARKGIIKVVKWASREGNKEGRKHILLS